MEKTTWTEVPKKQSYAKLNLNLNTDIAIIGGGIAGILSAYTLAKEGYEVVLLEAGRIGSGVTAYTTTFITQDIDTDLSELVKMFGARKARQIWDSGHKAIELIEKIVKSEKIECEFIRCPLFIYANDESGFDLLKKEHGAAKKLNYKTSLHKGLGLEHTNRRASPINFPNYGYWQIPHQAKFNASKFLYALAEKTYEAGAQIFENTEVQKVKDTGSKNKKITIQTKSGTLTANRVIITTYQPFNNPKEVLLKKGMYDSYILEAKIPHGEFQEAMYLDTANPYHYFRIDTKKSGAAAPASAQHDRIIIGGEDHRSELKINPAKNFAALEKYLKEILNGRPYTITKKWSNQVLEPTDGIALIGEYQPNHMLATGFSGNGMTYAAISAMIFRDIVASRKNPWVSLYNPKRIPTLKQLAYKAKDYGSELVKGVKRALE